MASYLIEIDDKAINEQIQSILNAQINNSLRMKCSGADEAISAAVKDIIYSHKDEIIERVIDRATTEIVKKGLPKLLERMGNNV